MHNENYSPRETRQLIESIRIQKARRKRQKSSAGQDTNAVNDMLSEMNLLGKLQEITRNKLARELHDGLTQIVSALAMRVNFARRMLDTDPKATSRELQKVENLTRETAKEIRHMIFRLRPVAINSHGIGTALDALVEKMHDLFDLEVDISIDQDFDGTLPVNTQQILYAIVEEGVDNARKNSGAAHVWVKISESGGVVKVEVEDDGEHITLERDEVINPELENIQQLSELLEGAVRVNPLDGKGNRVQVEIPSSKYAREAINLEGEQSSGS
jgi:signal transduction histidine kinase